MKVNWRTYYEAAKQCHDLAGELRHADKPVHDAVKGECAGMAGDAPGCKQWGEAYDRYTRDTMQTCTDLADALTNLGNILYANGYKYGKADNANPESPPLQQVSEYKVTIPTSVHDNGDVDKLSKAATTWKTFSTHATITGAPAKIATISALFDDMDATENRTIIQEHFGTLKSSADLLVSASTNVAAPVADHHSSTVEVGDCIKTAMTTFAWAVGLLVTGAIVGAIFSFGGSIAVAGGGVALAVEDTIATLRGLYTTKRLFQILEITLAASVAVGVIDAFGKVPDLTESLAKLAAIIALKVAIDGEEKKLTFEPSPKHGPEQRGNAAPEPTHPQETLDKSVQIKPTSSRRVGLDSETGEFDVFDETYPESGIFHGHKRAWDELTQEMQNALIKAGVVNRKGKPL
ncbi:hypothetical protein [Nocardia sp. CA-120079]|uniref:hypothetical protein n=1 Tax=Nocardia sp. CA-120079 TaxID=3239974 RepID=UPI003D9569F9